MFGTSQHAMFSMHIVFSVFFIVEILFQILYIFSMAMITLRSFFKSMCTTGSSEFQKLKFQVANEPS